MTVARRFGVTGWKPLNYKVEIDENGEEALIADSPTEFRVQLFTEEPNGLMKSRGLVSITLNVVEYPSHANTMIKEKLIEMGLLSTSGFDIYDPLYQLRVDKWSEIVTTRDDLEAKGFHFKGKIFDSDERSVARINTTAQAALAAMLSNTDFSADWVTADNHTVQLTREELIQLPAALAQHADNLHRQARAIRQRLSEATTAEEIRSIAWGDY